MVSDGMGSWRSMSGFVPERLTTIISGRYFLLAYARWWNDGTMDSDGIISTGTNICAHVGDSPRLLGYDYFLPVSNGIDTNLSASWWWLEAKDCEQQSSSSSSSDDGR